jgi:4-hydroxybenzoate polyprenyltransferase
MIGNFLRFIRFSHTIFALPFAVGALFVAADGLPTGRVFLLVILAMVFARTAAMTFNRLTDWEIDQKNPRTAGRHKLVAKPTAILACLIASSLFIATTAFLNPLCLALSPVALFLIFFYSYTKRFTSLAQLFLGLALGVAPVGAWLAVTGQFAWAPIALAGAVMFWVAGFDIIYATQDFEIDRRDGLHSLVVRLGLPRALAAAPIFHLVALAGFLAFGLLAGLGPAYYVGLAGVGLALGYEHILVRQNNLESINKAFFQVNAAVSGLFVLSILADRVLIS